MAAPERNLRADAARNYERIVEAAAAAFEDVGPDVTLEDIAARAAVNVATVYRRFGTRDQLVRSVFEHVLTTEIGPATTIRTDDSWNDLIGAIEATTDVLARRRMLLLLAKESGALDIEGAHRYLQSMERLLHRAVGAGVVRPELEVRDVAAVIIMILATVHPGDPDGADTKRYRALLVDALRPSSTTLPPPSSHDVHGSRFRPGHSARIGGEDPLPNP